MDLRIKGMTAAELREALIAAEPDIKAQINEFKKCVSPNKPQGTPTLRIWTKSSLKRR